MTDSFVDALAAMRGVGTPESLAGGGDAPPGACPRVNAHIHLPPNFSAFASVTQALELAAAEGVAALGASNYYDYAVYGPFAHGALTRGIHPLFGLEIISLDADMARRGVKVNDPGNPGRMYICGKGTTGLARLTPGAAALLERIRRNDASRMETMAARMASHFAARGLDTGLAAGAVADRIAGRLGCPRSTVWLQERHLCQAFQEAVFDRVPEPERASTLARLLETGGAAPAEPVAAQNEIRARLLKTGKPAYVEETFVNREEAVALILETGGIPCYPVVADGMRPVSPWEADPETLIRNVRACSFACVEFITPRNTPAELARYVTALRQAGLLVTAGTEHNTQARMPVDLRCADGSEPVPALRAIFWEGACVTAAHQFLVLHGRTGFVDGQGRPNPAWRADGERIAALARLGARVIGETRTALLL